jgi:hypothetical protein
VAKLVTRLAALWVRIQATLKNKKMGDIKKGVASTLYPAKKKYKKTLKKKKVW